MNENRYFSKDYFEARERFKSATTQAGARLEELEIKARGPGNERLSLNFSYLGAPNPRKLLVHTSGIHGIEGFAGSAIQIAALDGGLSLPSEFGVNLCACSQSLWAWPGQGV